MKRFEYKKDIIDIGITDVIDYLNEVGYHGWECFKIEDIKLSNDKAIYLKREIKNK